jgi:hypothetical protein
MDGVRGQIVWQVLPVDDGASEHAFDASVVFHERAVPPYNATPDALWRHMRDHARSGGDSFYQQPAPFEQRMNDVPLTLTVRPHPGSPPVRVTFAVYDVAGQVCRSGSLESACSIIVHSASGTVFTSLPDAAAPASPFPDSALL